MPSSAKKKQAGPVRKPASPAKKQASPAKKRAGPVRKPASPAKKPASPAKKQASPAKKQAGPEKKPASPAKKQAGPARKPASPAKKRASPAKKVGACKPTWIDHVESYRGANGCTYKEAMVGASKSWREAKYGVSFLRKTFTNQHLPITNQHQPTVPETTTTTKPPNTSSIKTTLNNKLRTVKSELESKSESESKLFCQKKTLEKLIQKLSNGLDVVQELLNGQTEFTTTETTNYISFWIRKLNTLLDIRCPYKNTIDTIQEVEKEEEEEEEEEKEEEIFRNKYLRKQTTRHTISAKKQAVPVKKAQQHHRGVRDGIGEWKLYGIKVTNPWYKDTKYVLSAPVSEGTILPVGLVGVRGEYDVRKVEGKGVFVSVHLMDDLTGLWEPRGGIRVKLGTKAALSTPPKGAVLKNKEAIVKEILSRIEKSKYGSKLKALKHAMNAVRNMKSSRVKCDEDSIKDMKTVINFLSSTRVGPEEQEDLVSAKKLLETYKTNCAKGIALSEQDMEKIATILEVHLPETEKEKLKYYGSISEPFDNLTGGLNRL